MGKSFQGRYARFCLALTFTALGACTARFDGSPAGPTGIQGTDTITGGAEPGTNPAAVAPFRCNQDAPVDPGPAPLKRLTPRQYMATVRELFGSDLPLADVLPTGVTTNDIGLAQPDPSAVDIEAYLEAARRIGAYVETRVDGYAPCAQKTNAVSARTCARGFLTRTGTRIYRSPLSEPEAEKLLLVFDAGFAGGYGHGVGLLVQAMLAAPRFLYRPELSESDPGSADAVALTGFQMASRLSFAFWNQGPDEALLAAAASGELDDSAGVAKQVERLMNDPRGDQALRDFLRAWLGLTDFDIVEKDPSVFPVWSEPTRAALAKQSEAFFDAVLFGSEGTLNTLFTLDAEPLAPASLQDWHGHEEGKVKGVLGLPAILAQHSKPTESFPIYRGLFVRQQLLCQLLPPPPPNAGEAPPRVQGVSARERFEQHSSDSACRGCHVLIDPLGFAFERYDALGRYRDTEDGLAIDTSGELRGTDVDGPFADLSQLSSKLADSETVRACASRQWFRAVMQRFEQPADDCSMQALSDAFASADYSFASLRTAIVQTDAFRMRRPIELKEDAP